MWKDDFIKRVVVSPWKELNSGVFDGVEGEEEEEEEEGEEEEGEEEETLARAEKDLAKTVRSSQRRVELQAREQTPGRRAKRGANAAMTCRVDQSQYLYQVLSIASLKQARH